MSRPLRTVAVLLGMHAVLFVLLDSRAIQIPLATSHFYLGSSHAPYRVAVLLMLLTPAVLALLLDRRIGPVPLPVTPHTVLPRALAVRDFHIVLVVLALLAAIPTALHSMDVSWSDMISRVDYLVVRDPGEAGISVPGLDFWHTNISTLGLLFAAVFGYALGVREPLLMFLWGPVWAYSSLISLAFGSRLVAVQFVIVAAAILWTRRRLTLAVLMALVVAVGSYDVTIGLRSSNSEGHIQGYGLAPSLQEATMGTALQDVAAYSVFNLFNGGFAIAEGLRTSTSPYPTTYAVLSFSPLPSAVDGFGRIRSDEQRINEIAPFPSMVEAWKFGPHAFAAFIAIWLACGALISRAWRRGRASILYGASLLFLYGSIRVFNYQLRTSLRFIVLGAAMAAFALWLARIKAVRE